MLRRITRRVIKSTKKNKLYTRYSSKFKLKLITKDKNLENIRCLFEKYRENVLYIFPPQKTAKFKILLKMSAFLRLF